MSDSVLMAEQQTMIFNKSTLYGSSSARAYINIVHTLLACTYGWLGRVGWGRAKACNATAHQGFTATKLRRVEE